MPSRRSKKLTKSQRTIIDLDLDDVHDPDKRDWKKGFGRIPKCKICGSDANWLTKKGSFCELHHKEYEGVYHKRPGRKGVRGAKR